MNTQVYNTFNKFYFQDLDFNHIEERNNEFVFSLDAPRKIKECPHCKNKHIHIHSSHNTFIRDIPAIGKFSYFKVKYRKYKCLFCGKIFKDKIPLKHKKHRITNRLYNYVIDLFSQDLTITQIANITGLSRKTIKNIHKKHLLKKYTKRRKIILPDKPPMYLGVDEFLLHRPFKYATVVIDLITGNVLWIGYGKSTETLLSFFKSVKRDWINGIKAVAMDMNAPYAKVIEEHTNASIVYDRFHIIKNFNEAVNKIRMTEIKSLLRIGKTVEARELAKSKYYLLNSDKHIKEKDEKNKRFNEELMENRNKRMITNKPSPRTKKSWKAMKEKILAKNRTFHLTDLIRIKLEDAYMEHDKFTMRNKIEKIINLCKSARKAPLTSFAKMLEKTSIWI